MAKSPHARGAAEVSELLTRGTQNLTRSMDGFEGVRSHNPTSILHALVLKRILRSTVLK